jgi:hypothetical protein
MLLAVMAVHDSSANSLKFDTKSRRYRYNTFPDTVVSSRTLT